MLAPDTLTLTAVFIYSRKDEGFKSRFGDFLRLLHTGSHITGLSFQDIESLSPYRFRQKVDNTDLFVFAGSPHLFAHPNMRHPVFRRLISYHHTGRLLAVNVTCRPWKTEETVLKSVVQLPGNGQAVNSDNREQEDENFLLAYNTLCSLCENWREKKAQLEESWQKAQSSHEVEAYHAFLQKYPHSRYSKEARNLADNLSEAALWMEASEHQNLQHYFRYLLAPSQQQERLDAAALKIAEIEEDEERFWADTEPQKGPEFFFRYKAMFPDGKYSEEADKKIRKALKKLIPLASGHIKASENHYLMHLAYKRLPEEEYFSLSSYLLYCSRIRGYVDKVTADVSWRRFLYPILFLPIVMVVTLFSWRSASGTTFEFSVSEAVTALFALLVGIFFAYRVFHSLRHLHNDWRTLKHSLLAVKRSGIFLKVGFLTNDPKAVWEAMIQLNRMEKQLKVIEQKNFLHYLFPEGQAGPEWVDRDSAA